MDFKLVLRQKADSSQFIIEEGPNRPLGCGTNEVEMTDAVFKLNEKDALECKVWVETEMLSPFDLAASWKARQENLQPSRVRGTYDVVLSLWMLRLNPGPRFDFLLTALSCFCIMVLLQ